MSKENRYEENRKLENAVRLLKNTCIKHDNEDCDCCPLYEVCISQFPSPPKFWELEQFLSGVDNI